MNDKQKTRKSLMAFMRESAANEKAARTAFFRKTNMGTRALSRDQLATLMIQYGVTLRDCKAVQA